MENNQDKEVFFNTEDLSNLKEIINKQIDLNEKIVPNWVEKNLDWKSAILAESGELIESTDYKWWKKTDNDIQNIKVEAIDLLHFSISHTWNSIILEYNSSFKETKKVTILNQIATNMLLYYNGAKDNKNKDLKQNLFLFLTLSLNDKPILASKYLMNIFYCLDMSIEDIYNYYMSKNLLNVYRQLRGYKKSNYVKIVNGIEDNQAILTIISENKIKDENEIFKILDNIGYGS